MIQSTFDKMLPHLLLRNSPLRSAQDQNMCFTNAALQLLRSVPQFKERVNQHVDYSAVHKDLQAILCYEGLPNSISAHSVRQKVGMRHDRRDMFDGQQNDSLEFLELLLHCLHPSILFLFRFKTKTIRKYIITGQSGCQHCGRLPTDSEHEQQVLQIGFPNLHQAEAYRNGIPLQHLINQHFSQKDTEQEHGLRCSNCCKHQAGEEHDKRLCKKKPFSTQDHVTKHPQYLILQLLRFQQGQRGLQKIEAKVIDIRSIDIQETKYELISVLNHQGTYDNGHYTALLKSESWFLCDDIKQSKIDERHIENSANYVYMFKKKEPEIPEQPQHEFIPTDEYQEVPQGYHAPGGLEWQIHLGGKNRARLIQDGKKRFTSKDTTPSQPTTFFSTDQRSKKSSTKEDPRLPSSQLQSQVPDSGASLSIIDLSSESFLNFENNFSNFRNQIWKRPSFGLISSLSKYTILPSFWY